MSDPRADAADAEQAAYLRGYDKGHDDRTATASTLVVTVHGQPAPQGSKRHVGRGIMIESSKRVAPWREAVKSAALGQTPLTATGDLTGPFTGPLALEITFTLARPKHHYRTGRNAALLREHAPTAPAGTPDLSKLIRSTEDALTDAGVWRDDAQVVEVLARKVYSGTHPDALEHPGAVIRVGRADA